MEIDLTDKIKVFLNILFIGLILFNIIVDLSYSSSIDYGNIIWMVVAMVFINIIK